MTAREGCEFAVKEMRVHRAGSHGSLSADDSQSILLASGLAAQLSDPMRTIDVIPQVKDPCKEQKVGRWITEHIPDTPVVAGDGDAYRVPGTGRF